MHLMFWGSTTRQVLSYEISHIKIDREKYRMASFSKKKKKMMKKKKEEKKKKMN